MQHATIELTGIATTVNVTQLSAATQWTICFIHDLQWAQNTKTTKIKKRFFPECCGFVAWNSIKILTTTCIIQMLYHVFDLHKRVCKCWCRWFRPMPRKVSNDLIIQTGRVEKKKKKRREKSKNHMAFPSPWPVVVIIIMCFKLILFIIFCCLFEVCCSGRTIFEWKSNFMKEME